MCSRYPPPPVNHCALPKTDTRVRQHRSLMGLEQALLSSVCSTSRCRVVTTEKCLNCRLAINESTPGLSIVQQFVLLSVRGAVAGVAWPVPAATAKRDHARPYCRNCVKTLRTSSAHTGFFLSQITSESLSTCCLCTA